MRIVDIRGRSIAVSRYADPAIPSGGLTTSLVAVVTDVMREGKPVVGYGFASCRASALSCTTKHGRRLANCNTLK
jgi:hypothetical protein